MFTIVMLICSMEAGCQIVQGTPPIPLYDTAKGCITNANKIDKLMEEKFPEHTIITTCVNWGVLS